MSRKVLLVNECWRQMLDFRQSRAPVEACMSPLEETNKFVLDCLY